MSLLGADVAERHRVIVAHQYVARLSRGAVAGDVRGIPPPGEQTAMLPLPHRHATRCPLLRQPPSLTQDTLLALCVGLRSPSLFRRRPPERTVWCFECGRVLPVSEAVVVADTFGDGDEDGRFGGGTACIAEYCPEHAPAP